MGSFQACSNGGVHRLRLDRLEQILAEMWLILPEQYCLSPFLRPGSDLASVSYKNFDEWTADQLYNNENGEY